MRAWGAMTMLLISGWVTAGAGSETGFPSGSYSGTAEWRGPGGSAGKYEVAKTFTGRTLNARYAWRDEQPREEQHTVTFASDLAQPTFQVFDGQGQVVGTGHCYGDACAYSATFGPVQVQESFSWSKDEMTVLGSKSGPGFSVVWKETLQAR